MLRIVIISPSVRKGRKSHSIALYFNNLITENRLADSEIIDLLEYNFPLFNERLKYQADPAPGMIDFSDRIKASDGVLIVSPEYNGAPPASLKNAVDLLTDEWRGKPVAFATVSDGNFAGTQAIISLQFSLWKLGALTMPGTMRFPNIDVTFTETGEPRDKPTIDKRAIAFVRNFLKYIGPAG